MNTIKTLTISLLLASGLFAADGDDGEQHERSAGGGAAGNSGIEVVDARGEERRFTEMFSQKADVLIATLPVTERDIYAPQLKEEFINNSAASDRVLK